MSWTHVDVSIPVEEVLERKLPKNAQEYVAVLQCWDALVGINIAATLAIKLGWDQTLTFRTPQVPWLGQGAATDLQIQTNWKWNHCMDQTRKLGQFLTTSYWVWPGWHKLCKGTKGLRRKVWTQTKILSPNIHYFVAIYALFGNLWTKKCPFLVKNSASLARSKLLHCI